MNRAIVNVATGYHYIEGQDRLRLLFTAAGENVLPWQGMPIGCPPHEQVPYAFKGYALKYASERHDTLLWCDACIVPGPRPLAELWEKIERDGYWIARNGYTNYEWTADSAYVDLLPRHPQVSDATYLKVSREANRKIPHVVATAFGISLKHETGRAILAEYFRLASETRAFCGPWTNTPETPCGPSDVRGHRHDQTALSVIAWRAGCTLSECPEWFAYKGSETEQTCLVADGAY